MLRARLKDWILDGLRDGLKLSIVISLITLGGVIRLVLLVNDDLREKQPAAYVGAISIESAYAGGSMTYLATLCNRSKNDIDVAYSFHFISDDEIGRHEEILPTQFSATVDAGGCDEPFRGVTRMPAAVTAGEWRLKIILFYTLPVGPSKTSEPFTVRTP